LNLLSKGIGPCFGALCSWINTYDYSLSDGMGIVLIHWKNSASEGERAVAELRNREASTYPAYPSKRPQVVHAIGGDHMKLIGVSFEIQRPVPAHVSLPEIAYRTLKNEEIASVV